MSPSEGIKHLRSALKQYRPLFPPKYLPYDLADLRQAVSDDEQFGEAVAAIADAIALIHIKRERIGKALKHELKTWFRYSFESPGGTDLRVIYQPVNDAKVIVLGFGHRHYPHSIYLRMAHRLIDER
jgi:hypothetical protein